LVKAWKIVLVTTGLLLVMLAALAWVIFSRPLPLPTLAFLNYTNKPFTIVVAQVAFKNPSKVLLEILPQTRSENVIEVNGEFSHAPGYHSPFPSGLPRTIPPGGTTILDIHLYGDFREPWWTEVATRPQLEASRLRDWAARIKQPTLRQWAQRLFPPVQTSFTKLGPFTNLPPDWVRVKDGSARRSRRIRAD
jgi:hypothetical protein